jgi:hypothetical protein
MIKKSLAIVAVCSIALSGAFADGKGCCPAGAKTASNETKRECLSFANLNLTGVQKSKLEKWQGECMKAGCTKKSYDKFLKQAKSVLSDQQYATLKKECEAAHSGKVS